MNKLALTFGEQFPLIYQLFTTRLKFSLAALAALFLTLALTTYGQVILASEDLFTKAGPIIGGDFIVFNHAAKAAGTPDMISIYEMETLKTQLQEAYPGKGDFNFAWMYPPTMYLVIAPFGPLPYLVSFTLWVVVFAGAFFLTLSKLWADKWAVFFVASSPAVFQGVITGQNGFLTATLIAIAGAFADRRPILAGVAAGLLTIKPQLGLLIPVAFIAAGCWRAFGAAAATAILLAAVSCVAFGVESWTGFYEGVAAHGARMTAEGFPFHKLVTPFGFATMLGVDASWASAVQIASALALAAYVFLIWRNVKAWDLRLAALATSAMLATPYAFYYELTIMAPAMLLIAKRAVEAGWLPYEKLSLVAVWILPLLMPAGEGIPGVPVSSLGAALAFVIAARRALPAAVTFSSAAKPSSAGF